MKDYVVHNEEYGVSIMKSELIAREKGWNHDPFLSTPGEYAFTSIHVEKGGSKRLTNVFADSLMEAALELPQCERD